MGWLILILVLSLFGWKIWETWKFFKFSTFARTGAVPGVLPMLPALKVEPILSRSLSTAAVRTEERPGCPAGLGVIEELKKNSSLPDRPPISLSPECSLDQTKLLLPRVIPASKGSDDGSVAGTETLGWCPVSSAEELQRYLEDLRAQEVFSNLLGALRRRSLYKVDPKEWGNLFCKASREAQRERLFQSKKEFFEALLVFLQRNTEYLPEVSEPGSVPRQTPTMPGVTSGGENGLAHSHPGP
jgi:hypothetical protein